MIDFFRADYIGVGPGLFSIEHLLVLLSFVILTTIIIVIYRPKSPTSQWRLLQIMSLVYVFNFIGRQTWLLLTGTWDAATALPLHLCSYMLIFIPLAVWTKSTRAIHITYAIGLPGALMALLFPADWIGDFPLLVYRSLETITTHMMIAFIPLFMIFTGLAKIEFKRIKEMFVIIMLMLGFSWIANLLIGNGANYMFVMQAPNVFPFNAIEAAIGYGYLVVYVLLLVLLWVILFLPFKNKNIKMHND